MKNIKIFFIVFLMLFLFGCPHKGIEKTNYFVENLTDKSVKLEFFRYAEGRGANKIIVIDLMPYIRQEINEGSNAQCGDITMCSDSVRVTFADGKSKIDVNCLFYEDSDIRSINCRKDTINFLYTTVIETPTKYVFYVRDADYNEAK
jgi:hypothetical protein